MQVAARRSKQDEMVDQQFSRRAELNRAKIPAFKLQKRANYFARIINQERCHLHKQIGSLPNRVPPKVFVKWVSVIRETRTKPTNELEKKKKKSTTKQAQENLLKTKKEKKIKKAFKTDVWKITEKGVGERKKGKEKTEKNVSLFNFKKNKYKFCSLHHPPPPRLHLFCFNGQKLNS